MPPAAAQTSGHISAAPPAASGLAPANNSMAASPTRYPTAVVRSTQQPPLVARSARHYPTLRFNQRAPYSRTGRPPASFKPDHHQSLEQVSAAPRTLPNQPGAAHLASATNTPLGIHPDREPSASHDSNNNNMNLGTATSHMSQRMQHLSVQSAESTHPDGISGTIMHDALDGVEGTMRTVAQATERHKTTATSQRSQRMHSQRMQHLSVHSAVSAHPNGISGAIMHDALDGVEGTIRTVAQATWRNARANRKRKR